MEVIFYETVAGSCPVADFISELEVKAQEKITWCLDKLETYGTQLQHEGRLVSKLKGYDMYELRVDFGKVFYRLIFVVIKSAIWVLHAFKKKSNGTPQREIDTAERRHRQILVSYL